MYLQGLDRANLEYIHRVCALVNGTLDEPNVSVGITYVVLSTIYICLYIPCMIGILNPANIKMSCYKIMAVMGAIDMVALSIGIVSGCFSIVGISPCNATVAVVILGHCVFGSWSMYCCICIYLGINRCCDIYGSRIMEIVFEGYRLWLFMIIPLSLGGAVLFFGPAMYYNSHFGTWYFHVDPYTEHQGNLLHLMVNTVAVGLIILQYLAISLRLYMINRHASTMAKSLTSSTKKVLVQAFLISLPLLVSALMYIIIQFLEMPPAFTFINEILWQSCHGGMAIIYLLFNSSVREKFNETVFGPKTIRVAPARMVTNGQKLGAPKSVTTTHGWCNTK